MNQTFSDLIAAIATAPGEAAIGVVRLSGPGAGELLGRVVWRTPTARPLGLDALPSHRLVHGYLVDPGRPRRLLDEVMAVRFAAPRSYTREEMAELHTHGGVAATRAALALVLRLGARLAEPGEFTLRAFLNGRLDLGQAEAVMEVVRARTEPTLGLAARGLVGHLRRDLVAATEPLRACLAWLEASVDFPEDEVPWFDASGALAAAAAALAALAARAASGAVFRDGLRVTLAGRPNVGKSSLMNALLRYDRAIVTPVAGTTRDTLSEGLVVAGVPLVLTDTAGLGESADPVERIGIARGRDAVREAGVVVFVVDGSAPLEPEEVTLAAEVARLVAADDERAPRLVLVLNKSDQPRRADVAPLLAALGDVPIVETSAVTPGGVAPLERALAHIARALGGDRQADPALLSARQQAALVQANEHVAAAVAALAAGRPADIVAVDTRAALDRLGEITGETASETLLDDIFARFCIGK